MRIGEISLPRNPEGAGIRNLILNDVDSCARKGAAYARMKQVVRSPLRRNAGLGDVNTAQVFVDVQRMSGQFRVHARALATLTFCPDFFYGSSAPPTLTHQGGYQYLNSGPDSRLYSLNYVAQLPPHRFSTSLYGYIPDMCGYDPSAMLRCFAEGRDWRFASTVWEVDATFAPHERAVVDWLFDDTKARKTSPELTLFLIANWDVLDNGERIGWVRLAKEYAYETAKLRRGHGAADEETQSHRASISHSSIQPHAPPCRDREELLGRGPSGGRGLTLVA